MKKDVSFIIVGVFLALLFTLLGFLLAGLKDKKRTDKETLIRIDTVRVMEPVPSDSLTVRRDTIRYAIVRHHRDTVLVRLTDTLIHVDTVHRTVSLPITRRTYKDSLYTAVVSGYRPALESIEVYSRTVTRNTRYKAPRFSFGVGGGYFITPRGPQPGIGVTLNYNIFTLK